jgi:hypothetical protein
MITAESAQDFLDADAARIASRREPLLTHSGHRILSDLVKIMQPIPQAEIDAIIRGSLKDKSVSVT